MRLGVTATRRPLTVAQMNTIVHVMRTRTDVTVVHHGDCINGDAYLHAVAMFHQKRIVIHPPTDPRLRAWCNGPRHLVTFMPRKPYLDRNQDIVDDTDELLAVPDGPERVRSGTWSTVRYARKRKDRQISIVWPNGKLESQLPG